MKKYSKYGMAAVALAVVIIVVVALTGSKSVLIVPSEYVKVSCSGLDGEGTARLSFDAHSFLNAIREEKELKPAQESELEGMLVNADKYFHLSENTGLSNGDEISIESDMPSDFLKPYRISVKNSSVKYTVAGLTDMQTIPLENYGTTSFYGFEGYGEAVAYIDYDELYKETAQMVRQADDSEEAEAYIASQLYSDLYQCVENVSVSQREGLSNGDSVTVTYPVREARDRIEAYGIVFVGGEEQLKVEGLQPVETMDIGDYLKAEVRGYDGAGEIKVSIDEETMARDLAGKLTETRNGYEAEDVAAQIQNYIDAHFTVGADQTERISNGEEIRIFAESVDGEMYVKTVGFRLEGAEKTISAEGLEDPQEVDLMDLLTIDFSGTCPKVQVEASIDEDSPLYSYVSKDSYYDIPYEIYAQNGDTLDVTLEYQEEAALEAGYRVVNSEKSYEITGLDTYDFPLDSVDAENLQHVEAQCKTEIQVFLMDREEELLENLTEGRGLILWSQVKQELDQIVKVYAERAYYDFNKAFFVYKASLPIMQQDESVSRQTVYAAAYFTNLVQTPEGNLPVDDIENIELFYSKEALEEALSAVPDSISRQEGSECTTTVAVSSASEEEETQQQTQEAADRNPEEATPAVSTAVIPEISEKASENAAKIITYDGHCYYRFDTPVTWKQAKEQCEQMGGHLVTVTSWTEQSILEDLIADGELEQYWIGAADEKMEGSWTWVNGESFTYDAWNDGQPDNYDGTEDYAYISRYYGGKWNDGADETEDVGYILEISAEEEKEAEYLAESQTMIHQYNTEFAAWEDDSYGSRSYGVISYDASNNGWTQYELNGAYEYLTGETAVYADAASGVSMDFAVFGDGKLLYRQRAVTRQTDPRAFSVDLTGVQTLTIETGNQGEYSGGWLLLGKAKLYPASQPEVSEGTQRIGNLVRIDAEACESDSRLWTDAEGVLHDRYVQFDAGCDSFAQWNLGGQYETLSGKFVLGRDTGTNVAIKVQIYGDEELLFESEAYDKTKEAVEFVVDVTGKRVLKVVTDDAGEGNYAYVYLVDDLLSGGETAQPTETSETASEEEDMTAWDRTGTEEEETYHFPELSDEVTVPTAAFAEYETHRYYLFEMPMTWKDAEKFCEHAGGHLAAITSPLEQRRIEKLLRHAGGSGYWIGGTDEKQEGSFIWSSGEDVSYTNWRDGEPNNSETGEGLTENYMAIYAGDGSWGDADAAQEYGFILELSDDRDTHRTYMELAELDEKITESEEYTYYGEIEDSKGKEYMSSYVLDASNNGWVTYDLDGLYTEITGILSTYRDTQQNVDMSIGFFGDGRLLYGRDKIQGWDSAEAFQVDVTGVKTLTIKTYNSGEYGYGWLLLNDTVLNLADTQTAGNTPTQLNQTQLVDFAGMEYEAELFQDTYGELYNGAYSFSAPDGGYGVYLLDGKYTQFSGAVSAGKDTQSDNVMKVQIYADEELLFEQDKMTRADASIPFSLDVTGKKNLKIVTSDSSEAYSGSVYVAGALLN